MRTFKEKKIFKTNEMSTDLEVQLGVLRKEKAKAIENCQFAKAKALDSHITTLKQQIEVNKTQNKVLEARLKFDITRETITKELISFQSELSEQEKERREHFNQRLITIENNNQKATQELADKLSKELEKASMRPVPEAESMKLTAQKNAKLGYFDLAESLFDQANAIRERVIKERQTEIIAKHDLENNEQQTKYQNEVKSCKEKRELAIADIHNKLRIEIEKRNKELNSVSIKLGLGPIREDLLSHTVAQGAVESVDATDILKAVTVNENEDLSQLMGDENASKPATSRTSTVARKSPMTKTSTLSNKSPMMKSTNKSPMLKSSAKKTPNRNLTSRQSSFASAKRNTQNRSVIKC